jgi:hypothetical protein
MSKKRKKHPAVHVSVKDEKLAKDPNVQKFCRYISHKMTKELKALHQSHLNALVFGSEAFEVKYD